MGNVKEGIAKKFKNLDGTWKPGVRWGRGSFSRFLEESGTNMKIIELRTSGVSIPTIRKEVTYADKNNNIQHLSVGYIHKLLVKNNLAKNRKKIIKEN